MALARAGTKQALLVDMLGRERGSTIREIVDKTGWKANTVHSALSTLRAKGRDITAENIDGERRYKLSRD